MIVLQTPTDKIHNHNNNNEVDTLLVLVTEMTSTVTFNVGGKLYEVSQSLVASYPDTMLAKISSKTWNENQKEPIFIDRDNERFGYVLDYLRDGFVNLPCSISKDALLQDFQYYGFQDIKTNQIRVSLSVLDVGKQINLWRNLYNNTINSLKQTAANIELETKYCMLAYKCLEQYIQNSSCNLPTMTGVDCYKSYGSFVTHSNKQEFDDANGIQPKFRDNKLLKKCANKFGIEFVTAFFFLPEKYAYHNDMLKNSQYSVKFGMMSTCRILPDEN